MTQLEQSNLKAVGAAIVAVFLCGAVLIGLWVWSQIDAAQDQAAFNEARIVCETQGWESQPCTEAGKRAESRG